jgi:hypothetical protein
MNFIMHTQGGAWLYSSRLSRVFHDRSRVKQCMLRSRFASIVGTWCSQELMPSCCCAYLLALPSCIPQPGVLTVLAAATALLSRRNNFSFFFTFWDELYGTAHDAPPPVGLSVMVTHAVYGFAIITTWFHLLPFYPVSFFTTWVLLYLVIPPTAASAVANWVGLPEATRRISGWFMDIYRRDNYVTYAPSGAAGSFQAATGAGNARDQDSKDTAAAADSASTVSNASAAAKQAPQPPAYIFACHPTGLLSRAAFLTFGARGWCSPVSGLPRVRVAVSSILLRVPVPFWREFLLACGCVPADRRSLRQALLSGTSVAITPGGWAEAGYLQSYRLVLQRRKGFVALAAQTGGRDGGVGLEADSDVEAVCGCMEHIQHMDCHQF